MKIYLAGPLFTLAERIFNEELANALQQDSPSLEVELPQRYASQIAEGPDFSRKMFNYSISAIDDSVAVVAILDGADSDSGTCVEIGYAKGKGKIVIGLRTDFRSSEDRGMNLMVANICDHLILELSTKTTLKEITTKILQTLTTIDVL